MVFLGTYCRRQAPDAGHPAGYRGVPRRCGIRDGLKQARNNTTEANITLKTKKGVSETKRITNPKRTPIECNMRELKAEIERCRNMHVLARASNCEWGRFETAQAREIPRTARNYKNRGNEAKKSLKTKDITFFNGANFAPFMHNSAATRPQKDQTTADFAKTRSGLASPARRCDSDRKSASAKPKCQAGLFVGSGSAGL